MRAKAGLTETKWKSLSSTADRLVHAAQSPRWRCGARVRRRGCAVMLRAVPAMRTTRPSASRSTARPRARTQIQRPFVVADAVLGQEHLALAVDVAAHALQSPAAGRRVVDRRPSRSTWSTVTSVAQAPFGRVHDHAVQLAAGEVEVPVVLAGRPQRHLETLLAVAQLCEVGLFRGAGGGRRGRTRLTSSARRRQRSHHDMPSSANTVRRV